MDIGDITNPWDRLADGAWQERPDLVLGAFKRVLLGHAEFDESALSAATGVSPGTIRVLWRAMGFPDFDSSAATFTEADVAALHAVKAVLASRGEAAVVEDARVLSSLLARVADVIANSLTDELERHRAAGRPNSEAEGLVNIRLLEVSALLDYLFRRLLLTELTRQLTAHPDTIARPAVALTGVIFADLVGFTNLSEQLDDDALAELVMKFQSVAFDLVASGGGRIVKTLGDEVMIVCDDVEVALEVATTLATSYADEEFLPDIRVGMAYGPVLAAQGDFFGPTVNLASRLVAIAPPGMVVISDEAKAALGPESQGRLNRFGPRLLKGIGWTMSWVVYPSVGGDPALTDEALDGFYSALLDDDPEELYERAPCGYLSTTPEGTVIKVNQTFLTWTGYDRHDLVGRRRFVDLLTGGGRIYHETHYAPMLQIQGSVREIALDIVARGGRRLPALVNAILERDETGSPVVVRVAVFDATERRGYERELLRAKQHAEESEVRARFVARTLQETLIPPSLPAIAGLEIAAAYRPAGKGDEIGGDFYDVFEVGEGNWVVVIGDVSGKGAEAAVVTALARYTIRAAAARLSRPSEILETLNGALLRHHSGRFCTVAAARLWQHAGDWKVMLSCGGHPFPLLARPGTTPVPCGEPGTLLGIFSTARLHDFELTLEAGDQLVFYTDGVTEARRARGFYGDERLHTAVAGHDSPQSVVDSLLTDVLAFQGGSPVDDIAIVAVRVPSTGA